MQPPVPPNEAARLSALYQLNVLDSSPEADFDYIVALASDICGAPISLVTLVDAQRQWFKAKVGFTADETARDVSFCAHAIMGRALLVVPDTTLDARFADNPFVRAEHGIRFYAGAPLVTDDGSVLGTLCVVDHAPHRLSLDQMLALRALARQVTEYLELRRLVLDADPSLSPRASAPSPSRTVDLTYLLEGRIEQLRPIADGRNIAITFATEGDAMIGADPSSLARALDYVVFTALKAAPPGGRVGVRVLGAQAPAVEVVHAGGSIPPAWQADLAGMRAADEPVPRAAAAVLRAHGATVAVTSEPRGSSSVSFEIRFPPR